MEEQVDRQSTHTSSSGSRTPENRNGGPFTSQEGAWPLAPCRRVARAVSSGCSAIKRERKGSPASKMLEPKRVLGFRALSIPINLLGVPVEGDCMVRSLRCGV